ncbi:membrane peptidoglycan carboxypeptidase [Streptomyces sp. TLI_235]|nr:transglycosylase domain-containing protein [Streptomyces sp. TLI_235]PBC79656.1 membrane peptidoglycan carboxypeptidase [Streptomyces sp. TLI_235]
MTRAQRANNPAGESHHRPGKDTATRTDPPAQRGSAAAPAAPGTPARPAPAPAAPPGRAPGPRRPDREQERPYETGPTPGTRRDRRRLRRRARRDRRRALPRWRRAIPTWRTSLTLGGGGLLLAAGTFAALYLAVPVPDPNAHALAQSNVYYYADGTTEIARTGAVNREDVTLDQVPAHVRDAVVSAEDRSFYRNRGIDLKGMLRAAWQNVSHLGQGGRAFQGGSTITQQYVKNYYLTQEQTLTRKARELFISLKVDRQDSKDEILAGYLNTSYFGRGAYGVQTAARAYFGTDAAHLDLAQGAYLAALLQAPSAYDVRTASPANREKAVARWNYVLDGMVTLGFLDPATRAATTFPEVLDPQPAGGLEGQAGYLVDIADDWLTQTGVLDTATLKAGGWRITTTFDKNRQDAFVNAVKQELTAELDPGARPRTDTDVRVAGASVEPGTGRIVAAYGGPDYAVQPYNDALRQDNQVGSTFKPIDLAAALEGDRTSQDNKPITTQSLYDGTSGRVVVGGPTPYAPPNEDNENHGQITLREAMMRSVNSVYAQLGIDAGLDNVRRTAIRLGLPDSLQGMDPDHSSMTLGTATPSALDLAAVYAALANHGQAVRPWAVSALDRPGTGDRPVLPAHEATTAVSRTSADAVTDVLRDTVGPRGTGATAQALGRPAAGKTGTTDDNRSAWFAGYTPELATVVGLFREDKKTHAKESLAGTAGYERVNGGTFPARIWTSYMGAALNGAPVAQFDLQPGPGNTEPPSPSAQAPAAPKAKPKPKPKPKPKAPAPAVKRPAGRPAAPAPAPGLPPVPRPTGPARP